MKLYTVKSEFSPKILEKEFEINSDSSFETRESVFEKLESENIKFDEISITL